MRYLQIKAYKVFKILIEWELVRNILKYTVSNQLLPTWLRQYTLFIFSSTPLASSYSIAHLRCFQSNQPRSIITFFKSNRMRFKFDVLRAKLVGVKKSSW